MPKSLLMQCYPFVSMSFNKYRCFDYFYHNSVHENSVHITYDKYWMHAIIIPGNVSCTILRVKSNTCNLITLGECGVLPPSIICHKQVLCYYKRLHAMNDNSLVKKVFINFKNLADMGFRTWITSMLELASKYDVPLDNELTEHEFKVECVKSLERTLYTNGKIKLMTR